MKGIIFSSVFAIMFFVGSASAQHVKVFTGVDFSELRSFSSSSAMPTFDLIAGEPIKLQASAARIQSANNLKQMSLGVHTYPTPCEGEPVVRKAGGTQQEYLTITLSDVFISATEASWKGTCRILSVNLKNGKTYRARIRFR